MSIRSLDEVGSNSVNVQADICVIGAGMAGLVAARKLARSGRKVVVIESGGRELDPKTAEWNRVEDVFGSYQGAFNGRFRGLGGSSIQWGGRLLPLKPADVKDRPHVGVEAWPLDLNELEKYRQERCGEPGESKIVRG